MGKLLGTIAQLALTGIIVSAFLDTNLGKKVEKKVVSLYKEKKESFKESEVL